MYKKCQPYHKKLQNKLEIEEKKETKEIVELNERLKN